MNLYAIKILYFFFGLLLAVSVVPSYADVCDFSTKLSSLGQSAFNDYIDYQIANPSVTKTYGTIYYNQSTPCSNTNLVYKYSSSNAVTHYYGDQWNIDYCLDNPYNTLSTGNRNRRITFSDCVDPPPPCPEFDRYIQQIFAPTGLDSCVDTCVNNTVDEVFCTSSNGIKDADEVGIDCGGSSPKVCEKYCPIGFHAETRPAIDSGNDFEACYSNDDNTQYTFASIDGTCPSGTYQHLTNSSLCVTGQFITLASGDYLDIPEAPPVVENVWNETSETEQLQVDYSLQTDTDGTTTETETKSTDIVKSDGTTQNVNDGTTTVTNPDGSKTVTNTVTTITHNSTGGTTSSTTTLVTNYGPDGKITGQYGSVTGSGSEPGTTPGSEDPFAALTGPGGIGKDGIGTVERLDATAIDFGPFRTATNDLMTRFPFSVITHVDGFMDEWIVTPQSPQINLTLGMLQAEPFVMNLSLLDPLAAFLRMLLGFVASVSGAYVVIRTWRG